MKGLTCLDISIIEKKKKIYRVLQEETYKKNREEYRTKNAKTKKK